MHPRQDLVPAVESGIPPSSEQSNTGVTIHVSHVIEGIDLGLRDVYRC
jgi:hypothetical protein